MYLEKIDSPKDLKKLTIPELKILAAELREFFSENMSFINYICKQKTIQSAYD